MGKILEPNGDESENDHTGGMACAPCQGTAQCLDGSVEREGSHRHEVISTSDDMNGAGGNSSENADQHSSVVQRTNSAGAERLSRSSALAARCKRSEAQLASASPLDGASEHFHIRLGKIAHAGVEHWLQMVVTANQKPIRSLY